MTTKKKRSPKRPPRRKVNLKHPLPPGAGPFGDDTDPEDSNRLRELRSIIDDEIGWRDDDQMEGGDYAARLREVGRLLKEHGLNTPRPVSAPVSEEALRSARYWGAEAEANPGSSFQYYATDIALKAGYKTWTDVPKPAKKALLGAFKVGRDEERQLVRGK